MKAVQVGHAFLNISTDVFEAGDRKGTIIDSGTTLAYLPDIVYEPLVSQIFSQQPDMKIQTLRGEYTCFEYSGSVDDGFPAVTFYFENSLSLKVYPHDYLFPSKYDVDPAAKAVAATVLGIQVGCGLHSGDESRANVAQDNELLHQNPQAYVAQDGNWIARIAALLVGED